MMEDEQIINEAFLRLTKKESLEYALGVLELIKLNLTVTKLKQI